MPMIRDRLIDAAACALVGDGLLGALMPEKRLRVWLRGPSWWQEPIGALLRRPALARVVAAGEVAVGVWLATRERPAADGRFAAGGLA